MIYSIVDFANTVFPGMDREVTERLIGTYQKNLREGHSVPIFLSTPLSALSQGDIIGEINFPIFDTSDFSVSFLDKVKAIIISTSCDIDHDDTIVLAPLYPIELLESINIDNVKNNKLYDFLCFKGTQFEEYVVDFSQLFTFPKDFILSQIADGKMKRHVSLDLVGYYLFLVKLSIYFFRREDVEMHTLRSGLYTKNSYSNFQF